MPTFHIPVTTHAANDVFSSAEYNNIGDSLNFLLAGIHASGKYDKGSDITSTSTTFAAIDSTNLAKTVTLTGTKALLIYRGIMLSSVAGARIDLDINVNGTRHASTGTEGSATMVAQTNNVQYYGSLVALVDGLTPGSNTFQILWKASAASTMTLRSGNGVAGQDFIPAFDILGW